METEELIIRYIDLDTNIRGGGALTINSLNPSRLTLSDLLRSLNEMPVPARWPIISHYPTQENTNSLHTVTITQNAFNKFITCKFSELQESTTTICAICISDFNENDIITKIPCQHVFCNACIKEWLCKKSTKCPLCRTDVRSTEEMNEVNKVNEHINYEGPPPLEPLEPDISLVMAQTGSTREAAISSLILNNYDIVDAIMNLV